MSAALKKVLVVGLDGLEPELVRSLLERGELPNLARLRDLGGFAQVATTCPAQTPVAWSSFATGTNPGGHGIFDFIRRHPETYLPDLALNRYEQKNPFVPPRAVNLRRGTPVWKVLSDAGLPSAVLRCPCTYPPDSFHGRMLSGMGVPDLRGGLGTATFYAPREVEPGESENAVRLEPAGEGTFRGHAVGPRHPRTKQDLKLEFTLHPDPARSRALIRSAGHPAELEVEAGRWSEWLKVKFKANLFLGVRGAVRFYLVRLEPELELYASPVNFDAQAPLFPISSPPEYARELEEALGPYHTTGMVEEHNGLTNGRFDETAYMQHCELVLRERERMMLHELERFEEGLFFCLFDTPDRVQHMLWRFREPEHPANRHGVNGEWRRGIEEHYRRCDEIAGKALEYAGKGTLMIVLSDHGFTSFQRGVHLNRWLHEQGLLALAGDDEPTGRDGEFFRGVDWKRTQAYAVGLSGIYLNLKGREGEGIVDPAGSGEVLERIARGLAGLRDPERASLAVRSVRRREEVYRGPWAGESPDLLVNFSRGYRVSWTTALGGIGSGLFEDNTRRWSGDHIVDPELVPGVLFMNRPFDGRRARLIDMAPTILDALGVPPGEEMEGESLIS